MFINILEPQRHELPLALGFTLVTSSLHGWKAFSIYGISIHTKLTWILSPNGVTSLECHSSMPSVPMYCSISKKEVCDTYPQQMELIPSSIIYVVSTPIFRLPPSFGLVLCFPWSNILTMHPHIFAKSQRYCLKVLCLVTFKSSLSN